MTRALPRAHFSSPRLIRLLAQTIAAPAPAANTEPKPDFAGKLGQWLHVSSAISLHAALDAGTADTAAAKPGTGKAVVDEVTRTRTALMNAIMKSCSADAGTARIKFPVPQFTSLSASQPVAPADIEALYAPFRRFHLTHQREMEQQLGPMRAAAREAVAKASPALKQLADVDAVFASTLAERERSLLAKVPSLLEQRFEQLFAAHRQSLADSGSTDQRDNANNSDDPAHWLQPGQWLARYREELKQLLLAELDLRLQPIMGLVESLGETLN